VHATSRRTILVSGALGALAGAGAYGFAETDAIPGRFWLARRLGRCGDLPDLPRVGPGPVVEKSFGGGRVVIGRPPGVRRGTRLPVVLMLPGSAGNARTPFDAYGVQHYLADAVRRGTRPFAVAAMDRPDPAASPGPELLAFLRVQGLRTDRVGVLGWSIGGRGALELAAALGTGRVAAVAAVSPAMPASAVRSLVTRLKGIPLHVTCGRYDPFAEATRKLLSGLHNTSAAEISGGIFAGCHDSAFRRRMLAGQIPFLGRHFQ
jgi:hypothetical protein